jgi:hypothetical protein
MISSDKSPTFRDHAVRPGYIYTIFNAIFGPPTVAVSPAKRTSDRVA